MGKTRQRRDGTGERPSVRDFRATVPVDGVPREQVGVDIGDVIRVIAWDLKEERGWSQTELGAYLGVTQQAAGKLLAGISQPSIDVLSALCATLRLTPAELFQRHERYRPTDDEELAARLLEDQAYGRFRSVISMGMAKRVLGVLETLNQVGDIEQWVGQGETLARAHKTSTPSRRTRKKSG